MRLAYFLCIPALIVAMGSCAQKTNAGNISNPDALSIAGDEASTDTLQSDVVPFQFADIKPSFNGGDANKFSKWVNENLNYPENCKKEGICGRVTLTFTVTETGKVTDVKVLRGVHEDLDKEALRVVSSSPELPECLRHKLSIAKKPALCLVYAYFSPGLPSPTIMWVIGVVSSFFSILLNKSKMLAMVPHSLCPAVAVCLMRSCNRQSACGHIVGYG